MRYFYTCKQAHQQISESLDRDLSLGERTRLSIHLSMCRSCSHFKQQMQSIRLAMRQMANGKRFDQAPKLTKQQEHKEP